MISRIPYMIQIARNNKINVEKNFIIKVPDCCNPADTKDKNVVRFNMLPFDKE